MSTRRNCMKDYIIQEYLNNVLKKQLISYGMEEKYILIILEDIKDQMYSLLKNWNNKLFIKALFILSDEQAKFYEPKASSLVKNFVVTTIRNSLVEEVFSVNFKNYGLTKEIDESHVKDVTKAAIVYFNKFDLGDIYLKLDYSDCSDKYINISKKYPLAWESFVQLARCNKKESKYDSINIKEKIDISFLNNYGLTNKTTKESEIQSGIELEFGKILCDNLRVILKSKNNIFFCDSFKMLTRNFEKLLKVIEILLENDKMFVTFNYLISNNYVCKRMELIKPSSSLNESKNKLFGEKHNLSKKHELALNTLIKMSFNT